MSLATILDVDQHDRAPLRPPALPTMANAEADPARAAVAASVAVLLARQLGLDTVAVEAAEVLAACVERLTTGP